jgi:predicted nucleic acid-binding protein
MENVLVDTGIWLAMFDPKDPYAGDVKEKAEFLDVYQVVLPWPTLYEALRTRMVRNRHALQRFESYLKRPHIQFLDDADYREKALDLAFWSSLKRSRPLSMVDCLLRLMLDDTNVKVNYLATFNHPDFIDICARRGIELI